jgi:hypothetical protein
LKTQEMMRWYAYMDVESFKYIHRRLGAFWKRLPLDYQLKKAYAPAVGRIP